MKSLIGNINGKFNFISFKNTIKYSFKLTPINLFNKEMYLYSTRIKKTMKIKPISKIEKMEEDEEIKINRKDRKKTKLEGKNKTIIKQKDRDGEIDENDENEIGLGDIMERTFDNEEEEEEFVSKLRMRKEEKNALLKPSEDFQNIEKLNFSKKYDYDFSNLDIEKVTNKWKGRILEHKKPVIAIVGKPNVGKSSLFNSIIRENKSLITDIPGTTRDRIYGNFEWRGHHYVLVDTGGMMNDEDFFFIEHYRTSKNRNRRSGHNHCYDRLQTGDRQF
eukprot:TRINITY_DN4702_c0_g1_i1.p1 TRINITY_DN4702_c0_g1~~TRINITY_DN4702_c0_g1_i1.p1  ORF type:complete len:276 (+),score=67.22 TRINITY_DN4702_c0_g1_i1:232-1059(+)